MALPDQWTEKAYIDITKQDGTAYQFGALTDTIDIAWGDKSIEATALVNGGRVVTYTPEEPTEITLEMFPVGAKANQTSPTGLSNWFMGNETGASNRYVTASVRYRFRVAILWTDAATVTAASGAVGSANTNSLRMSFWNCYLTSCKFSFTDDILKCTAVFTCVPYNKTASGMMAVEEGVASTLSAMASFTATSVPAWS
jgi:hypothetical protein